MTDSSRPASSPAGGDTGLPRGPYFSVVIPVCNSLPYLTECIETVRTAAAEAPVAVELIVVDNGSTDGSYEMLVSKHRPPFRVEQFDRRNIAAVRNFGARLAGGTYLCFLDSDVLIPPDYFAQARDALEAHGADSTGCEVTVPSPASWVEETWASLHRPGTDGFVHYLNSANFIVSANAFRSIGGFDETLTTGEDAEIGQRLGHHGFRIYQARRVSAVHLRNPKSLGEFLGKQLWHGRGALGTVRKSSIDKPLAMTVLHAILCVAAAAMLVVPMRPFIERLALACICTLFAPVAAVAYRVASSRLWPSGLARSIVLYHVYFDARAVALARILAARLRDFVMPAAGQRRQG